MRFGWLSFLLIVLLLPGLVLADSELAPTALDYTPALPRLADVQTPLTPATELDRLFAQALADIQKNNIAAAGDKLRALKAQIIAYGYSDANAFSDELITFASSIRKADQLPLKAFLVRHAIELSPNDGTSLIAAASFLDVFDKRVSAAYAFSGIKNLAATPLAVSKIATNALLLILVAFSLSFLFVASLQIVAHRERVFAVMSNRLKLSFRGLLTPVLIAALVTLPLFGGILLALGIWSLLLCRSLRHCRWLGLTSAVLILSWSVAIPLLQTVGLNSNSRLLQVIQDLNSGSYAPGAGKILTAAAERNPQSPYLPFNLALLAYHEGDLPRSAELFQHTIHHSEVSASLRKAALVNSAVTQYQMKKFEKAKEALLEAKGLGNTTVEILYNLAQVEAALTNTESFREYYNAAAEMDRDAVIAFDAELKSRESLVMVRFSGGLMYRLFTKDVREIGAVESQAGMLVARDKLYGALMVLGSPLVLMIFGALVLMGAGLTVGNSRPLSTAFADNSKMTPALVWAFIPAGLSLVSDKPVQGGILLGVILSVIIAGFQQPVQFLTVLPVAVIPPSIWFIAAGALALLIGIFDASPRLLKNQS